MDAQGGVEPPIKDYEPFVMPFHYRAIDLVLVRYGYIQNTLGIQSHQALYLDCSLSPPLASDLYPALQLVALTRRHRVMVDRVGFEPTTYGLPNALHLKGTWQNHCSPS